VILSISSMSAKTIPPESPENAYSESSNAAAYPLSAETQAFLGIIDGCLDLQEEVVSQKCQRSRKHMKTHIRQRQLRGLVLYHRRHPSDHPRRLVNRTARWKEPPQNGQCRWCYEPTAHIRTRWHLYCLNAYRVASGQHPEEIQHTLCEMCGEPSDEMDHRLAINVARALGPAAMLRAFTPDNLRWLCRSCHRRKTRQDRKLAKFLAACSLDWYSAKSLLWRNHRWALAFTLPCSLEPAPPRRSAF